MRISHVCISKFCLLVYKAVRGLAPQCLTDSVSLCLWSVAEADCDRPRGVTSSSSQHQQTSGDDPLLCPLQQHGTNCHQTSGIRSRWDLSNTDSRLICLTVIVFCGTFTIRALVMGDGLLCYGALEIVGLLLLLLLYCYHYYY